MLLMIFLIGCHRLPKIVATVFKILGGAPREGGRG
jgi:hypothetical protein